jgi:hypothetical protein
MEELVELAEDPLVLQEFRIEVGSDHHSVVEDKGVIAFIVSPHPSSRRKGCGTPEDPSETLKCLLHPVVLSDLLTISVNARDEQRDLGCGGATRSTQAMAKIHGAALSISKA